VRSQVANYAHPEYPELEDFGDCEIVLDNNATGYFRVDWLTPDGLQTWGDGRLFILGTEGFIEQRKYMNLGFKGSGGGHVFLANGKEETYYHIEGKVGFPFFGQLVLNCLNYSGAYMPIKAEGAARNKTCYFRGRVPHMRLLRIFITTDDTDTTNFCFESLSQNSVSFGKGSRKSGP
jgi:hypothetical protein